MHQGKSEDESVYNNHASHFSQRPLLTRKFRRINFCHLLSKATRNTLIETLKRFIRLLPMQQNLLVPIRKKVIHNDGGRLSSFPSLDTQLRVHLAFVPANT